MSNQRALSLAIRWLILAFAVWVAAEVIGGIHLEGWQSALAVALILGLLNLYIKPVLTLLTLPLTILTLGLFLVLINASLLGLTATVADWFDGINFEVDGFGAAILGAIIISLVNVIAGIFISPDRIARNLTGGI